jgi:GAF domain-containing protein
VAADPLAELTALAAALRAPLGREAQFALADATLARLFGHTALTVNRYDAARDESERVYSSVPGVFPLGGRKRRKTNGWSERVIDRGEIHVGSNAAAIAAVFDDHALIAGLGCAAIMNIPVRFDAHTLGSFNLMGPAGQFDRADRAIALAVVALMIPVMSSF